MSAEPNNEGRGDHFDKGLRHRIYTRVMTVGQIALIAEKGLQYWAEQDDELGGWLYSLNVKGHALCP